MAVVHPFDQARAGARLVTRELGISHDDHPDIAYMVESVLVHHRNLKELGPKNPMRDHVVDQVITRPTLRQFNAVRIHHRPYYLHRDDITDDVYCAILLETFGTHIGKYILERAKSSEGENLPFVRGAVKIAAMVTEFENHAYKNGAHAYDLARIPYEAQIVLIASACHTASWYIEALKLSVDEPQNLQTPFIAPATMKQVYDTLSFYRAVLADHTSGLASCFTRLMQVVDLEKDRAQCITMQQNGRRGLILPEKPRKILLN